VADDPGLKGRVIQTSITRGKFGFGFSLAGPAVRTEASAGVFVATITEGSSAAENMAIEEGLQVR